MTSKNTIARALTNGESRADAANRPPLVSKSHLAITLQSAVRLLRRLSVPRRCALTQISDTRKKERRRKTVREEQQQKKRSRQRSRSTTIKIILIEEAFGLLFEEKECSVSGVIHPRHLPTARTTHAHTSEEHNRKKKTEPTQQTRTRKE